MFCHPVNSSMTINAAVVVRNSSVLSAVLAGRTNKSATLWGAVQAYSGVGKYLESVRTTLAVSATLRREECISEGVPGGGPCDGGPCVWVPCGKTRRACASPPAAAPLCSLACAHRSRPTPARSHGPHPASGNAVECKCCASKLRIGCLPNNPSKMPTGSLSDYAAGQTSVARKAPL